MDSKRNNPLYIENVVERIINFLSNEEARKCRLICKLWESEANRGLKSRQSVTITSTQEIKNILEHLKYNPNYFISHLILYNLQDEPNFLMNLSKLMLIVKSQLSSIIFESGAGQMSQQAYEQLIALVGENVIKLEINSLELSTPKYFPVRHLESGELLVFPKIKSLKYGSFNFPLSNRALLSSTFKMFPNLVRLHVLNIPSEELNSNDRIQMKRLRYLRIDQVPNGIPVQLNYKSGLTDNNIQFLLKLELNLKELALQTVNTECNPELLKEFLGSQNNLEKLELSQFSIFDQPFCRFPAPCPFPLRLPSLTLLEVNKPFVRNLNHVFASCPKVEKIDFLFHPDSNWTEILGQEQLAPASATLHRLRFDWIDSVSLQKISSSLLTENITELIIKYCDDSMLRVVFEKFTNLENLIVTDKVEIKDGDSRGFMTDACVSGIAPETLKKLEGDKERLNIHGKSMMLKIWDYHLDKLRIHPHIGNLKQLTNLVMKLSPLSSIKSFAMWGLPNLSKLSTITFKGKMIYGLRSYLEDQGFFLARYVEIEEDYYFVKPLRPMPVKIENTNTYSKEEEEDKVREPMERIKYSEQEEDEAMERMVNSLLQDE